MWYDINKTKSHNALISMVIGPRGYGKTYGAKKMVIDNYLKDCSEFVYLRRYQSELDLVKESIFSDILCDKKYSMYDIEYKDGCYTLDGVVFGYPFALSTAAHLKSASFPNVTTIVFDEFIIDDTINARYLKNEVFKLLNFIETIARMRENVRVFMLANSLSFINPYTIYWDMEMPKGKKFCKAQDGLVMLELVGDDEFKEKKQKTGFGRLNMGSEFERMSVNNEFILDSDTFVEKRPANAKHEFIIGYKGTKIGVWVDLKDALYYCCSDYDPSCKTIYAATLDDHTPNTRLLKGVHRGLLDYVLKAFKNGNCRFENIRIKSYMTDIFRMSL